MFFRLRVFLAMRSAVFRNGAVAQLGERQNRTLEAGGSIPLCSTRKSERGDPMNRPFFMPKNFKSGELPGGL